MMSRLIESIMNSTCIEIYSFIFLLGFLCLLKFFPHARSTHRLKSCPWFQHPVNPRELQPNQSHQSLDPAAPILASAAVKIEPNSDSTHSAPPNTEETQPMVCDDDGNEPDDSKTSAEKDTDPDYVEDDQVHPRHVLVCAPSNAALDEIIFRILESGE